MQIVYFPRCSGHIADEYKHHHAFMTMAAVPPTAFQPTLDWCLEHFGHSVAWQSGRWVHGYFNSIHSRFLYHNVDAAMEGHRSRIIRFSQDDDAFHFRMRWC